MADAIYERASLSRTSIFHIIVDTSASSNTIVDNWIDSYKKDKVDAVITLLQFFIDSSGCKGEINSIPDDFTNIIRELTRDFNEAGSDYPLIQSGRKLKVFKTHFCNFLECLVNQCQNSILYDDYFMPKVIALLTGLSDSQVRAFRHTSTLAVMKILTALSEVYNVMANKKRTSNRQYDIEQSKTPERRTERKLKHLKDIMEEADDNLLNLREMIIYLFKAVFVHRFRDSVSDIRVICITELGMWLVKLPELFLDDSYLKYLAWSLNDKIPEVRKCTLLCLKSIFESDNLFMKMELFVLKCKDRIVSMTLDVSPHTAVEAVKLISLINDHFSNILTVKDIEGVYHLVFSENAGVSQAAGYFLNKKISEIINGKSIRPLCGNKITSYEVILKEIIDFFIESELHEHTAYLVDSLIDSCVALKEWESMTNLLLCEVQTSESLSSEEERVLIDIMTCSIKQTTTGVPPVGRNLEKKIKTLKEIRSMNQDKEKMTIHLITVLPLLLGKYLSDRDNILNLLQIPIYFDLNLFLVPSQNENVISLLKIIQILFFKYHDTDVLESCVKLLDHLQDDTYSLFSICETYTTTAIEITLQKLNSALTTWTQAIIIDEDLKFNLVDSIMKLSILYPLVNMNKWDLWKIIFGNLEQNAVEGNLDYPDNFIKYSLTCCYYNILWDLNTFEENLEAGESTNKNIKELENNYNSFMNLTEYILKNASVSCAEEAYTIFCDFLLIFGNKTTNKFAHFLNGFIISPTNKLRDLLFGFIKDNILIDLNSNDVADIYKKRVLISSYCKLFSYKILPVYFIYDLLLYYIPTYINFGDIFDVTIMSVKEYDKVDCARAMVNCLIYEFEKNSSSILTSNNENDFISLKRLAKKFSSILGMEKNNEIFLKAFHTEGIIFALRDISIDNNFESDSSNILFFDLLIEFTSKLNKVNKLHLVNYLKEKDLPEKSSDKNWQFFLIYKKHLMN